MGNLIGKTSLDVELLFPGDRFPVSAGPVLRQTGWRGGQFVMYVSDPDEDFVVEASDGTAATGFLWDQSEVAYGGGGPPNRRYGGQVSSPNDWTNLQYRSTAHANVLTVVNGGTRALFRVFETVALSGGTRSGGPITYSLNEPLKVSENGLLCNDSDVELSAVGIASPVVVGIVSAVPMDRNDNRLGVDLKF